MMGLDRVKLASRVKHLNAGMLMLLAMMVSSQVFARGKCEPTAASVLPALTLTVAPNHPVGQVIGASGGYAFGPSAGHAMRCSYVEWPFQYYAGSHIRLLSSAYSGHTFNSGGVSMPVYNTSVPGVGFAMMAKDPNYPFKPVSHNQVELYGRTHNKPQFWGLDGRVFFVATGPVSAGTISSQQLASFIISDADIASPGFHSVILSTVHISPPAKPTCQITTTAVVLPLGQVPIRSFGAVGSTAGNVSRNISLSCAGGGGDTRDVFITVTDQTQPSNRSTTLTLSSDSNAKGVAVQLLRGGTLISYGADSATVGNQNQWFVGSTGNGTVNIPISARYVRTAQDISPGTANGRATFTMAYR